MVLEDGSTVHVRPVRAEDEDEVAAFLAALSPEARALRFFSAGADTRRAASAEVDVDYTTRYGLLATRGEGRVVGNANFAASGEGRAEVAFAIADDVRGRGLGTILLAHLAEAAAASGIATLEATVLPSNRRMLEVFRESGFPVEMRSVPGMVQVEFPASFTPEAVERFERRDQVAASAAVRRFLEPRSVALVGASRKRGTVGGELLHNLLDGFTGTVYPVNPAAESVQSVRAYPDVASIPEPIDLAVVAVPAEHVTAVARDCAAKGVPALVVISAGFAESGAEGRERETELLEICRDSGIRLIGPNCLGVFNTAASQRLNATFAPETPPVGDIGFLSQSGALGLALIGLAGERGLGLSSFASIGNRADVTGNDVLEYWDSDPGTAVALLYIESFSDPRRFSRVAQRVGRNKPIVVVKSGRSQAGSRATSSHTGAMLAASDVTVDALFHQAGVIRTDSLAEMMDVASLLASQPLPEGRRVGIVTNAGGPGAMCADACEASGLEVPELSPEVQAKLRGFLAEHAAVANPVDMIATASAEQFRQSIEALAESDEIDALIVIFVRPLLIRAEDVGSAVAAAVRNLSRELPIQAVFMSERDRRTAGAEASVPTLIYPEDAVRALARVVRHADWRRAGPEDPIALDGLEPDTAAITIADALKAGETWLGQERVATLLGAYGISQPETHIAKDPVEAGHVADELGGRVAIKATGPEVIHKTDLGAVRLGVEGGAEASWAATGIDEELARQGVERKAFVVQQMVDEGVEMLVGVVGDAVFGPVLACGAGGVQAELLKDVAVRICPIDRREASQMIASLATYPLLTGYRGAPPADLGSLEDILLRLSALVEAHREIIEVDLNPVMAGPDGALAVDARIRVEVVAPSVPWPRTWQ